MFDLLDPAVYYERPIALRNPLVFYEGHLPAFAVNTLVKKGLGRPGVDERLETIFARGIDPETEATAIARGNPAWPSREAVLAYVRAADAAIEDAICTGDLVRDDHPLLRGGEALWAILEHEEMHQETLSYMFHELPYDAKRRPEGYVTAAAPSAAGSGLRAAVVPVPSGTAALGTRDAFAWDNERPAHRTWVAAFDVDRGKVTNGAYLRYVETTGAAPPHFWARVGGEWYWRGMFERVSLPLDWPVYVTWTEADAYARWAGRRLPTEAEFLRYAEGAPPGLCDFARWDPLPVGGRPAAASALGVDEPIGNGWEWTADVFAPFDGFAPMASYPEYSADFFDGAHYVMKGASPLTARALARPGFRNWFRPNYPHVYAGFRTVASAP